MKKLLLALSLTLAVPAAAQFGALGDAAKKAASKEADKAKKDAEKDAEKAKKDAAKEADKAKKDAEADAKKTAKEALKANLVDTLALPTSKGDTFVKLSAALASVELDKALKEAGPFTLFAPTDAAFAKISEAELTKLLADKDRLKKVLLAHVVAGAVHAKDVKPGKVKTHGGAEIEAKLHDGKVMMGNAHVAIADLECTNGVIHIVDAVIMPK